jgi:hypothetical protein
MVQEMTVTELRALVDELYPQRPTLPINMAVGQRHVQITETDLDRFLSKIRIENGRWIWDSTTYRNGYGKFSVRGTGIRAHRLSYSLFVEPIPQGMDIDHIRHNEAYGRNECAGGPKCLHRLEVDPPGLQPLDRETNIMAGGAPRAIVRRTNACIAGHPRTERNVSRQTRDGEPRWVCRVCKREESARRANRRRVEALSLVVAELRRTEWNAETNPLAAILEAATGRIPTTDAERMRRLSLARGALAAHLGAKYLEPWEQVPTRRSADVISLAEAALAKARVAADYAA